MLQVKIRSEGYCSQAHVVLLERILTLTNVAQYVRGKDGQESPHRNLSCADPDGDHLLFRILPVTLYGRNKQVDIYAVLDEGSSVTLIDDDIIQSLNLKGKSRQLNVQWFGGKSAREHTTVVSLQISGTGNPCAMT